MNKNKYKKIGGIFGFLQRKNYTLRRITTTGRDLPKDFLETINQFHETCAFNFIDDDEFDPDALKNMVETSIYIDKPSNYSFAKKVFFNKFLKNHSLIYLSFFTLGWSTCCC